MTDLDPAEVRNLDRYGCDPLDWDRARTAMAVPTAEATYFLGTCRPDLYRFTFHTAVGVAGAEPHGATRWRFAR